MFKKLIAAAVVSILSFTPALADQKMDDLIAATPQINGNCTATVIYSKRDEKSGDVKTVLLTAKHCVDGAKEADQIVEFPVYQNNRIVKKEKFIGKVLGTHFKSDLGLIELKDKKTLFEKTAKLAPSDLTQSLGDPTTVLGYSLGMAITVTHGTFGGLETIDWPKAGTEFLRATPMIAPGNSGGPLYVQNKAGDYELAGVTTALAGNITSFIGFYTPSTMIHEYLRVALPELVANK